jgi:hypothetical protein
MPYRLRLICLAALLLLFASTTIFAADATPAKVDVKWNSVLRVSKTIPTLLYIGTPLTARGSALHDPMLGAIHDLGADYVRYAPSNLLPKMSVAELEPPTKTSTSWDFSHIDPYTEDAFKAINGHPVEFGLTTIPEWMFKTPKPVTYPEDPNQLQYDYEQGKELRDPTCKEVADYYARVVSWYVKGGFTDELGKWHASGHHYKIDSWDVLNEPDLEHGLSPEVYSKLYDAVVTAVHRVSPQTKFVSVSSSYVGGHPDMIDYFLDPRHHRPGISIDYISYHFYAVPGGEDPPSIYPYECFDQADRFLEVVGYVETMRKRFSPKTGTMVDEIGTMLPTDWDQGKPGYVFKPIDPAYWNLSAAVYAYVFAGLARQGIDVATESLIPGYPGQFPSIAILDWNTGAPNARYRALQIIVENLHPGDKLVDTQISNGGIVGQGFVSPDGRHKLLIINKRNETFQLTSPEFKGAKLELVDQTTRGNPAATSTIDGDSITVGGLAVAVVNFAK